MEYRAFVQQDWPRDRAILNLVQVNVGSRDILLRDGASWQNVPDNIEFPPLGETGIVLPHGSLEPIYRAIADSLGKELPSVAEVSVLREWLAAEQGRTDAVFGKALELIGRVRL